MGFFQKFPYTDDHQLNLDWILRLFKTLHGGSTGQVLKKKSGKDFDWEWGAGGGGGGTTDYNDLSNKPSINGVSLTGNKTTGDLGISTPQPGSGTPAMDGTATAGVSDEYSRADHVHPHDNTIPSASVNTPIMDGAAAVGSSTDYARADHVHPSDTSKADTSSVHSVPPGGATGKVLGKASSADYDLAWITAGGGGGGGDIEWLTYGTSTSAEVETAYQAGKICYVEYNGVIYRMSDRSSATDHLFTTTGNTRLKYCRCNNGTWTNSSRLVPDSSSTTPADLSTAAVGTGTTYARADHVHKMPSASDVGAIATPISPSVGDFLVYTSGGWDAVTMADWSGGNY